MRRSTSSARRSRCSARAASGSATLPVSIAAPKLIPIVEDTDWAGQAEFRGSIRGIGSTISLGDATLSFTGNGFTYACGDGVTISGSFAQVKKYRHNDMEDLERLLSETPPEKNIHRSTALVAGLLRSPLPPYPPPTLGGVTARWARGPPGPP